MTLPSRPDKIIVKIPKSELSNINSGICFRVGNEYCCYKNSTARYSNTVCQGLTVTPDDPGDPDPGLSFNDYIVIFADEAIFPSAKNVFGYVYTDGRPNSYWYEDMDLFKDLYENQKIDINKILIFHTTIPPNCVNEDIYPTVDVRAGYEMPIPSSKIIPSPRNSPRCRVNNEDLTGDWINQKIQSVFGPIPQTFTVNIFVDDSPSLTWEAVSPGIIAYQNIAIQQNIKTRTILCRTERWLRWIVNTFNKNPICS